MSGGSLTHEDAVAKATSKGLEVVQPKSNELFVDIDNERDFAVYERNVKRLRDHGIVRSSLVRPSSSGKPHRKHVTVRLTRAVTDVERLLLQAALGSDRMRELLGWISLDSGARAAPTLFFEKPRSRFYEKTATVLAAIVLVIFIALAVLLSGCTPAARPPLDPTDGRAAVTLMAFGVQAAADQCTANARHLRYFSEQRSLDLVDACVKALIPARDAVFFVLPGVDPWKSGSEASVGCTAKAVRVSLERVRDAFASTGYGGNVPATMIDAIRLGQRLEPYAEPSCDPLHPTTQNTLRIDPNIAPVEPEYP